MFLVSLNVRAAVVPEAAAGACRVRVVGHDVHALGGSLGLQVGQHGCNREQAVLEVVRLALMVAANLYCEVTICTAAQTAADGPIHMEL